MKRFCLLVCLLLIAPLIALGEAQLTLKVGKEIIGF